MAPLSVGARLRMALVFTLLGGIGGALAASLSELHHGKTWAAVVASETSGYALVRYLVFFVMGLLFAPTLHKQMLTKKMRK